MIALLVPEISPCDGFCDPAGAAARAGIGYSLVVGFLHPVTAIATVTATASALLELQRELNSPLELKCSQLQ